MYFVDGGLVRGLLHDSIGKEWADDVTVPRGDRLFHSPRARIGSDDGMGGMGWTHRRRQVLGEVVVGAEDELRVQTTPALSASAAYGAKGQGRKRGIQCLLDLKAHDLKV